MQDSFSDIVREGLDMAVRVGKLKDSTLVARKLDTQQLIFVASPVYLAQHGTPTTPEQLAQHVGVVFRQPSSGRTRPWQVRVGRRTVDIQARSQAQINDGEGLVSAVVEGLGIAQVPDYMAEVALRQGRVVELMAGFRPPPMDISAVVPSARLMPSRVKLALKALEALKDRPR